MNGKCLLSGINLKTMEASDMLDIIHAMYEEDSIPLFEEHQKIKSDLRVAIWRNIYEKDYPHPYQAAGSNMSAGGTLPPEDALLPDEAAPKPLKPYIPPTNFEQFETAGLDAPLGGVPE